MSLALAPGRARVAGLRGRAPVGPPWTADPPKLGSRRERRAGQGVEASRSAAASSSRSSPFSSSPPWTRSMARAQ